MRLVPKFNEGGVLDTQAMLQDLKSDSKFFKNGKYTLAGKTRLDLIEQIEENQSAGLQYKINVGAGTFSVVDEKGRAVNTKVGIGIDATEKENKLHTYFTADGRTQNAMSKFASTFSKYLLPKETAVEPSKTVKREVQTALVEAENKTSANKENSTKLEPRKFGLTPLEYGSLMDKVFFPTTQLQGPVLDNKNQFTLPKPVPTTVQQDASLTSNDFLKNRKRFAEQNFENVTDPSNTKRVETEESTFEELQANLVKRVQEYDKYMLNDGTYISGVKIAAEIKNAKSKKDLDNIYIPVASTAGATNFGLLPANSIKKGSVSYEKIISDNFKDNAKIRSFINKTKTGEQNTIWGGMEKIYEYKKGGVMKLQPRVLKAQKGVLLPDWYNPEHPFNNYNLAKNNVGWDDKNLSYTLNNKPLLPKPVPNLPIFGYSDGNLATTFTLVGDYNSNAYKIKTGLNQKIADVKEHFAEKPLVTTTGIGPVKYYDVLQGLLAWRAYKNKIGTIPTLREKFTPMPAPNVLAIRRMDSTVRNTFDRNLASATRSKTLSSDPVVNMLQNKMTNEAKMSKRLDFATSENASLLQQTYQQNDAKNAALQVMGANAVNETAVDNKNASRVIEAQALQAQEDVRKKNELYSNISTLGGTILNRRDAALATRRDLGLAYDAQERETQAKILQNQLAAAYDRRTNAYSLKDAEAMALAEKEIAEIQKKMETPYTPTGERLIARDKMLSEYDTVVNGVPLFSRKTQKTVVTP